jgi:phosphoribosylamine--glycine ligase
MQNVSNGTLNKIDVKFSEKSAACVIMASDGYPASYEKGFEITIPEDIKDSVYVAGAAIKDGKLVTSGGRVLGVTSIADTLEDAIKLSYEKVERIKFDNAYYRHDIGKKALEV